MAMGQVGSFQLKALRDMLTQLPSLVDLYQAPFDPIDPAPYKMGLFSHFEEQLSAELQRASAAAVVAMYEETQAKLIDAHQELLQMSSSELERLREIVPGLQIHYSLQGAELCGDFQEDLQFHFSLGLNTLSAVAFTGSWLAVLRSKLSLVQSVVSVEYAAPAVLLVTALLLPRFLHWRYLLPVMCVCGGLYSYEWLAWTPRSKEAALKRQFVQHMKEKVQLQVKTINNSCEFQIQANLANLRGRLLQRLEGSGREAETRAQQLTRDLDSISVLSSRLKALRNAVQLSSSDLDKFREDFLEL
jgi:mitofusin